MGEEEGEEGEYGEVEARLMSLGPDCGVKFRIEEQALPWNKGGPSEFFDWLLNNLEAVAAVLGCSDPEQFFDSASWCLLGISFTGSYEFVHEPTGLRSLHDAKTYAYDTPDAARDAVAARYVRRLHRLRELLEGPSPLRFLHLVDNENEMNPQPPPSRDVIQRVRGLLPSRNHLVIAHDSGFATYVELAVAGVAYVDTRQFRLQTEELARKQSGHVAGSGGDADRTDAGQAGTGRGCELAREAKEPEGWKRPHLDWERLLEAIADAQPSDRLKEHLTRCECEVHAADCDVNLGDIYQAAASISLPGVFWCGWRTEPLFYGIEKLIVIVRLCEHDGGSVDDLLASLQNLEIVQSAKLLSAMDYADPFTLCSRLFSVRVERLSDLDLPCIGAGPAAALMRHGWTTIDDWMTPDAVADVARLTSTSMAAWNEGRSDGITWRAPEPRTARTDIATWFKVGQRPASDHVFAEQVLPKFDALAADLRKLMAGMEGQLELQLTCYPAGQHARYHRHTDAIADSCPTNKERKVTCIVYCNPAWSKASEGCLRLTTADHEMGNAGSTVDIEPYGGRLLCFLSGAMMHEVLPTQADRFAITAWVA